MEVEVKVIGMIGADFVTLAVTVSLEPGARVGDALAALHVDGHVDAEVYAAIQRPAPPLFVVINDERQEGEATSVELHDGDSVAIMQMLFGG